MADDSADDGGNGADSFRLVRAGGDKGLSLAERVAARLDRLTFASPLGKRHLKGRFPLKLLAVPVDPIPGDPGVGERLKAGRLYHSSYGQAMAEVRFDAPAAPAAWLDWANGWGWLRDMAAVADHGRDGRRVEAVAKRWLAQFPEYHPLAWRPDLTGRRILMWTAYSPWIIASNDHVHRSTTLNAIARWARHLDRAVPRMAEGFARVEAAAGLLVAGLLLPGGDTRHDSAEALLATSLSALLLDDGSAVSRCPLDLTLIGELLLMVAAAATARGSSPPAIVRDTLDRIGPTLKGLSMGDGHPAAWHGGTPSAAQVKRLATAGHAAADSAPGPRSGYQRLAAGRTIAILDAGPPPPSRVNPRAHASTLAFTLSDGAALLIVNCGSDGGQRKPLPAELAEGLRSTAAHSTLVLADTNSTRLQDGSARMASGVEAVTVERRSHEGAQFVEATHDGYRRRFGLDHRRTLYLSADGTDLRGEDRLIPVPNPLSRFRRSHRHAVAIRFHLGPDAEPSLTSDGLGALVRLGSAAWAFRASFNSDPGTLLLEPSLWIDPDGDSHAIQQLILAADLPDDRQASIGWSFKRQGK
ncbi:heparinase II/III family protein [Sandaracinobacteroides saxicola]|uniref:Heparinase II/III family protein n=1 Tax=Sandaracinobacteroides saxicola TaxID=2759707 RepID=A0A7G5IG93_9SPHN|nr:heparinase II/III family protein [Sandaracinobacteroides saxicola]QMW22385.1 heparinase II/III family protein [Sandaracinobacteroides saxicola]